MYLNISMWHDNYQPPPLLCPPTSITPPIILGNTFWKTQPHTRSSSTTAWTEADPVPVSLTPAQLPSINLQHNKAVWQQEWCRVELFKRTVFLKQVVTLTGSNLQPSYFNFSESSSFDTCLAYLSSLEDETMLRLYSQKAP